LHEHNPCVNGPRDSRQTFGSDYVSLPRNLATQYSSPFRQPQQSAQPFISTLCSVFTLTIIPYVRTLSTCRLSVLSFPSAVLPHAFKGTRIPSDAICTQIIILFPYSQQFCGSQKSTDITDKALLIHFSAKN